MSIPNVTKVYHVRQLHQNCQYALTFLGASISIFSGLGSTSHSIIYSISPKLTSSTKAEMDVPIAANILGTLGAVSN